MTKMPGLSTISKTERKKKQTKSFFQQKQEEDKCKQKNRTSKREWGRKVSIKEGKHRTKTKCSVRKIAKSETSIDLLKHKAKN